LEHTMNRFFSNLQKTVRNLVAGKGEVLMQALISVHDVFVQVKDRSTVIFGTGQSPSGTHDPPW
jgi:hypothetical protein